MPSDLPARRFFKLHQDRWVRLDQVQTFELVRENDSLGRATQGCLTIDLLNKDALTMRGNWEAMWNLTEALHLALESAP